jgi:hypothetical protein
MKSTTQIFIDESISERAGLATLTALIVPDKKFNKVTRDYYDILIKIKNQLPKYKNGIKLIHPPIVLHGNSLLRNTKENPGIDFSNISDEFRLDIFRDIINIVKSNKLRVIRIGINNYNEVLKAGLNDYKMYSYNWFGLSQLINRYINIKKALCIMEGNNMRMIKLISNFILKAKFHSYVYPDFFKSSVINGKEFMGNVYYVPGRYCEHLKIVDIISYILHKTDYNRITGQETDFSMRLSKLYDLIDKKRLINIVNELKINKHNP